MQSARLRADPRRSFGSNDCRVSVHKWWIVASGRIGVRNGIAPTAAGAAVGQRSVLAAIGRIAKYRRRLFENWIFALQNTIKVE